MMGFYCHVSVNHLVPSCADASVLFSHFTVALIVQVPNVKLLIKPLYF